MQRNILTDNDIRDCNDKFVKTLQDSASLDVINLQKVLVKFNENRKAINLIMYEYICRGNLRGLQTIFGILCQNSVHKESSLSKHSIFLTDLSLCDYEKQTTNTADYSFSTKVDFDLKAFAEYVSQKAKLKHEYYLGLSDDVRQCLDLVLGKSNPYVEQLMKKYSDAKAFETMDRILSL